MVIWDPDLGSFGLTKDWTLILGYWDLPVYCENLDSGICATLRTNNSEARAFIARSSPTFMASCLYWF